MTESEFNESCDAIFERIMHVIDDSNSEVECNPNGPVLEIDLPDGNQIIINRHAPNQEIWLAARSGGYHFSHHTDHWINRRDGSELYGKLSELIEAGDGPILSF